MVPDDDVGSARQYDDTGFAAGVAAAGSLPRRQAIHPKSNTLPACALRCDFENAPVDIGRMRSKKKIGHRYSAVMNPASAASRRKVVKPSAP
jgi:hypothetical protein